MSKAVVTLGGVPLAGNQPVHWRLTTGTKPYVARFSVHKDQWDRLRDKVGTPLALRIEDARGETTTIERLTILHNVPSDSPHRVAFVVADCRWKWGYKLVTRDFNVAKKTGTRFTPGGQSGNPVEILVTVDEYQYRGYSLNQGKRWTAKDAVEDVLKLLEPDDDGGEFTIDSFPIEGDDEDGQFTLQNVLLRDQGDAALARLLSYVPGADVFVAPSGEVVVFDATDLNATEAYLKQLPTATWDGDAAALVLRGKIRPREVNVHYQREVEVLFSYSDDYGTTSAQPGRDTPFIENVLPTVDPETTLNEWDPETNQTKQKVVKQGTWVGARQWLDAMDADRPTASLPWTFETIRSMWMAGGLEGALGAHGEAVALSSETSNPALRVAALRQHFRQTFRISRRFMERVRSLRAVRVGLLDPVTGARAPACVWGQAAMRPTDKFKINKRRDADKLNQYMTVNLDFRPQPGSSVKDVAPGPVSVDIIDEDLGIFRIDWLDSPFGLTQGFVPCNLVNEGNQMAALTGNLEFQTEEPIVEGAKVAEGNNGLLLRNTLDLLVMMTIVPASPNNTRQFHKVKVRSEEIEDVFRNELRIQGGSGPALNVFVPPGEATARYKWDDDQIAGQTVARLLGLEEQTGGGGGGGGPGGGQQQEPGIEGELTGFVLINEDSEIAAHSRAVAAEHIVPFADSVQGNVVTRASGGMKIVGNMGSAAINVGAAPSAKVSVLYEFTGEQRVTSRFAMLPESVRHLLLGVLPFGSAR